MFLSSPILKSICVRSLKFEEGLSVEIREKMSVFGSQNYKEVVQLAVRAEKLTGERRSRGNIRKEKGSNLSRGNHRKKVEVQTLSNIPLVLGLILLVHLSLPGRYNRLSWEYHCKVLLLEEEQCQRGALAAGSSIQEPVGHHNCVFSVDKPVT